MIDKAIDQLELICLSDSDNNDAELLIKIVSMEAHDYLFISEGDGHRGRPIHQDLENYVFQLVEHFQLDPERAAVIEHFQHASHGNRFQRHEFNWIHGVPYYNQSTPVNTPHQLAFLETLFDFGSSVTVHVHQQWRDQLLV